jgi:hypothetical protein
MCAPILATVPALQEIPRRKNKFPIFIEVVVYIFHEWTVCGEFLRDAGSTVFKSNSLEISGYFFFYNLFQASRATTRLAEVKGHDLRIVTTPTPFIPTLQPTGKQGRTDWTSSQRHL